MPEHFSLFPRRRILVIDNDPSVVEALACLLEDWGVVPLTAQDGLEGIAIAERERPDAVFVDLVMPEMDGIAVGRQLNTLRETRGMRVVLLTGLDSLAVKQAMALGLFDACLLKPFSAAQLFAALPPPPPIRKKAQSRQDAPMSGETVDRQIAAWNCKAARLA